MENIPIEASADGRRNAYHVMCSVMGHNRPYAACLNLCEKRKRGALDAIYAECSAVIGKKQCPAQKMRKEEIEKGQAIYFVERSHFGAEINPVSTPTIVRNNKSRMTSTAKQKKSAEFVDGGNISDAINNAFQAADDHIEEAKKVAIETQSPVVTAQQKVPMLPGESFIEYSKRVLQMRQQATN